MRALLVSIAAVIFGVFAAWSATRLEFAKPESPIPVMEADVDSPESAGSLGKIEVVGSETLDFGVMEMGGEDSHVFTFRNVGTGPLTIQAGKPTCKCTVSEMESGPLEPGQERTVKVTWKPPSADEKFQQRAPFRTSDPQRRMVELKIMGKVRETIRVEPNPLNVGQFSPDEPNTYKVRVWSSRREPWKLEAVTYSDEALAPYFEVTARDMTPVELEQSEGSYNGQVLTVTVKQGIPLGTVQQRILIAHNFADRDPVELKVSGKAVGNVTAFGKHYDVQRDFVDLGNVSSGKGMKASISLIVKGPHRDQVKFKIRSIDPAESLQAELGEPTMLSKSVSWPLTIEVPAGAAAVNRLGSSLNKLARIELESGTTEVPNYAVHVRVAVTPDE